MFNRLLLLLLTVALMTTLSASAQEEEAFRIGVVNIGPNNDGGWTTAHMEGLRTALARFGAVEGLVNDNWEPVDLVPISSLRYRVKSGERITIELSVVEAVAPEAFWRVAESLILNFGVNLLLSTAENYCSDTYGLAAIYPNINFATIHCDYENPAPNVASYFGRSYQAEYAAGAALAIMSKSGIACFVGAFEENGQVATNLAGFASGFRDFFDEDVEIATRFTGTWYGPDLEVQAAQSCPEGYDVAWAHQDSPFAGTVFAEDNAYFVGYDSDWRNALGENLAITSVVYHWERLYYPFIKGAIEEDFPAGRHWPGIGEEVVGLAPWSLLATDEAKEVAKNLVEQIAEGERVVFPHLSEMEIWNLSDWQLAYAGDQ